MDQLLDPVIMTLQAYYQTPQSLPPLDPDPESHGKPSDHRIVIARPVSAIDNQCAMVTRIIKVRRITDSGMAKMRSFLVSQVYQAESANQKA